jgi:hypothetical protein
MYTVEYYITLKWREILSFVAIWMNFEDFILKESTQTQEDKYHMISLTCRIWKSWTPRNRVEVWLPGKKRWDTGQRVQKFSYTMN